MRCCVFLAMLCVMQIVWPHLVSAQVDVAVVRLSLEDEATEEMSREVEEALAAGLRPTASRVFFLDELRDVAASGDAPETCETEVCGLETARRLGAQASINGRFSQLGQVYEVEAELLLTRDGTRLGGTSLTCGACTFAEALETVRRAGQGLQPSMPGLITLTVNPPGASVTIDDEPAQPGTTLALAAGSHILTAEAPGVIPVSRQITVAAGASSEVVLSLTPAPSTPDPVQDGAAPRRPSTARSLRLWGWLSFGAGLAALVPGVLWLGLEGQCAIGSESWNGICVEVYHTWPQGLAFTVVGTGLLVAAVTLLVRHSRQRRRERAVRLSIALFDQER